MLHESLSSTDRFSTTGWQEGDGSQYAGHLGIRQSRFAFSPVDAWLKSRPITRQNAGTTVDHPIMMTVESCHADTSEHGGCTDCASL